jgi:murein L,D-transpeptidase YcbB/YkuD
MRPHLEHPDRPLTMTRPCLLTLYLRALALLAFSAISCCAMAQPGLDRSSAQGDTRGAAETRALLASASEAMDKQQVALESAIREATARNKWSDQERARFLRTVLQSATNAGLETQIKALTTEMRSMLQASQRGEISGPQANARYIARLRQLVGALKATCERQSAYLLQQLRNAK